MKGRNFPKRRSVFWSRLLGLLIAFTIITVMVVGGVKNLMAELSAVHEDLTASQRELAWTQHELAQTQAALANESRALQQSAQQLDAAYNKIRALHNERDQIKTRWGNSLRALQQRNQQLVVTDRELREIQQELERLQQAPQLSVIVTSEREFQLARRERFAASHTRLALSSGDGALFYEEQQALHEKEQFVSFAERTQVLVTQTLPGHDVLECLADESKGCSAIIAAQTYASQQESYSYQAGYSSLQMLRMMQ